MKSKNNAFSWRSYVDPVSDGAAVDDLVRQQSADRAGENSAKTKRRRGQRLIPKLHLTGSRHFVPEGA